MKIDIKKLNDWCDAHRFIAIFLWATLVASAVTFGVTLVGMFIWWSFVELHYLGWLRLLFAIVWVICVAAGFTEELNK